MSIWAHPSPLDLSLPVGAGRDWLRHQWNRPEARVIVLNDDGEVSLDPTGAWARETITDEPPPDVIYLGAGSNRWFGLRQSEVEHVAAARGLGATAEERAALTRALALLKWHQSQPHCERCGSSSAPEIGGQTRRCIQCGTTVFPRTDPAVIVAVLDPDNRLFLARQAHWPPARVSVLAGFVEAGESAEQACFREVEEESAIALAQVRYFGSQPWPFPRSLMLGFVGRSRDQRFQLDGVELTWGDYFGIEEVQQRVAAGTLGMPGATSIASRMVSAWLAGTIHVSQFQLD